MGGGDHASVEMTSLRVAEFSDILDWRPMLFPEPIIAQKACSLCGVVYKKAVRLACNHRLCTKCYTQCVDKGGICPVDQEPFCEDDVELLEVSRDYILKRKVVCWNAPKGCSFVGPAAGILDHYKECNFSIVSCCLCQSSVLQHDILEHFKNGCNIHQATRELAVTPDLKDIGTACFEMKRDMKKISEDLMSLQTSLSQCSETIRKEVARCKDQWEADASRLTEKLNDLNRACSTQVAQTLQGVFQAAAVDYKEHLSTELSLQTEKLTVVSDAVLQISLSHRRPKKVHWYLEQWADLKKQVPKKGLKSWVSPNSNVYDYNISQLVKLKRKKVQVHLGCYMQIHPGDHDSQLEWPFRKTYTIGVIHPNDVSKVISIKVISAEFGDSTYLQRPKANSNGGLGTAYLSTAEKLEKEGFIKNDTLHLFLQVEP